MSSRSSRQRWIAMESPIAIGGDSQLAEPDAAGLGTNSLLKGTPSARFHAGRALRAAYPSVALGAIQGGERACQRQVDA